MRSLARRPQVCPGTFVVSAELSRSDIYQLTEIENEVLQLSENLEQRAEI